MSDSAYRLIKLNNGDNIISKIKKINNSVLVLEHPFLYKTMSVFAPNGTKNVILLKKWYEMSNEEYHELALNSVISMSIPNDKILFLYEKEKNRKQPPYVSNDELYKNPQLMGMIEDNPAANAGPKQVPLDENEEIQGVVNITLKITPELLEENEGLENLLRAMGVPIDQMYEAMEKKEQEMLDEEDEEEFEFGNDLEDWSPDPNDYLK
jgi:hypothetical protein